MSKLFSRLLVICLIQNTGILSAGTYPLPFSENYQGEKYLIFTAESITSLERYNNYYKYTMNTKGECNFLSPAYL